MLDRFLDGAGPFKAEVAVTGSDRNPREHRRPRSGTVYVELLLANSVGDSPVDLDDLRSEDIAVEGVRASEIADRDDDVIQPHARTIEASVRIDTGNNRGQESAMPYGRMEGSS